MAETQVGPGGATAETFARTVSRSPEGFVDNSLFTLLGLAALCLNKVRHAMSGYKRPRPFSSDEVQRSIDYDISVVDGWLSAWRQYTGEDAVLVGRKVLELGPGPDLGTGVTLLAKGAAQYCALDVNDLATAAPESLYDRLFARLSQDAEAPIDTSALRTALQQALAGEPGRLDYVCRKDFDVETLSGREIDLVVSQAAFEHFDDPDRFVRQLSNVVLPGALLIAEVDLQTHSRWLRDSDPLNIYRYPNLVYKAMQFSGSPNRWRPIDYERTLLRYGWGDVRILPGAVLTDRCLGNVKPYLNNRFRAQTNQMEVLNFVLCARKL